MEWHLQMIIHLMLDFKYQIAYANPILSFNTSKYV